MALEDEDQYSTTWKIGEMLEIRGEKIRVHEMSKPSGQSNMPKPHPMDKKEWFKKPGTATASALATRGGEVCIFCSGSHAHENCPRVTMLDERKKLMEKIGRCWICLRKGIEQQLTDTRRMVVQNVKENIM